MGRLTTHVLDTAAGTPGTIALKAVRQVPPPSDVGFRIKPLTLPLVIAAVDADGPAKAGGLAVGDIVTSIDGQCDHLVSRLQGRYGYPRARAEQECQIFVDELDTSGFTAAYRSQETSPPMFMKRKE